MDATLETVLLPTLGRLRSLYASQPGGRQGHLRMVVVKPGWHVVIATDGQCGAAMSFAGFEQVPGAPLDPGRVRRWVGTPLLDLAEHTLRSESAPERAVGVAALSAASQPFLAPAALAARGIEEADADFAQSLRPDDCAVLVGFGGMVSRLRGRCRELHVTDMRPRQEFQAVVMAESVGYGPAWPHLHRPEENPDILGRADAVAITGSALVNGSFAELLAWSSRARLVSVYGASAGFIPDVLFERGVHLVQSHRVSDPRRYEEGVLEEMGLEPVVAKTQTFVVLRRRNP
jgi:uncharacterized protein (DUF4213/DUF364 family)